jgi:hypothetical protein
VNHSRGASGGGHQAATTAVPANATDVALQLGRLARELDDTVRALEMADMDATEKRAAADLAFSRAFIGEIGSVDHRKHCAVISTNDQRLAADIADAVVRHLRRNLDAIKTRIDVGRSYGAALRAEIALGGNGEPQ